MGRSPEKAPQGLREIAKQQFCIKKRSFFLLLMQKNKNDLTNEINVLDINSLLDITWINTILIN